LSASIPPHPSVKEWLLHLERQGKSPRTLAAYGRALAHFARWSESSYGAPFDPAGIIPRDVRDYRSFQQTVERAAPATTNQRLVALSRFFAWALEKGLVRKDPTAEVNGLKLPPRKPKAVPERQLRRFLRALHQEGNRRDIALVEMLLGTGLRVGELLRLKMADLQLGERSGRVTVRSGKGGGFRVVPLTHEVRAALSAYLEERSDRDEAEAPLFTGAQGAIKERSSVLRILRKYALRAGVPAFGPHALRHTFATRYLKANPDDLRGLAALLGHASLDTVMVYTEPSLDDLAERLERVEGRG